MYVVQSEVPVNNDYDFWIRVADKEPVDFVEVFGIRGYEATCDFPSCMYVV
jgi:hypothetical protein